MLGLRGGLAASIRDEFRHRPFESPVFLSLSGFLLKSFDKLKSELHHREARLQKDLDEDISLRFLCEEKEVELAHLWYEASRCLNYESYWMEQVVFCPG